MPSARVVATAAMARADGRFDCGGVGDENSTFFAAEDGVDETRGPTLPSFVEVDDFFSEDGAGEGAA